LYTWTDWNFIRERLGTNRLKEGAVAERSQYRKEDEEQFEGR
jgi:hypothetical protein